MRQNQTENAYVFAKRVSTAPEDHKSVGKNGCIFWHAISFILHEVIQ